LSFFGFANTAAIACYGLVVLPFQARYLTPAAMGVWYSFLAMGSLAIVISQGGITPTVQRFASYFYAGARQMQGDGVPPAITAGPNWIGIISFKKSVNKLFYMLAIGCMALLSCIGYLFIHFRIADSALMNQAAIGWTIQVISIGLIVPAAGLTALVQGAGGMLASQRILLLARLSAPGMVLVGLINGYGVISLGLGTLSMAILQWVGHFWYVKKIWPAEERLSVYTKHVFRQDIHAMWPTTWRLVTVMLGAWLINSVNVILISVFLGLSMAGQYGLSHQIITFISGVSAVWMSNAIPGLCQLRSLGKIQETHSVFLQRWRRGIATYILGTLLLVTFGQQLMVFIGTTTNLLPISMLIVLSLIYLLELNHGPLCASYLMTANSVPFVPAAIISGVSIVVLGLTLFKFTDMGSWAFIVAQGIAQAAYNNWRWPSLVYKEITTNRIA
jgi:O-antigen/teichoic acid export membrane protein